MQKNFGHKNLDKEFSDKNFGRFLMKFLTIFKGISDEYNLLHNFQNVTYFEVLQNVTV